MNPPCYHRSLLQEETAATSSVRSPATSFTFNSPLALTIILLLIVLFFIVFFSLYIRRSFYITNSNHNSISGRRRNVGKHDGVHGAAVRSLPGFPYGGDLKMELECSICLSEFEERETVKEIPYCHHVFHPVCIDTWLSSHGSCPMCRSTRLFVAVDDVRVGTVRDLSVVTRGT